MNKIPVIILLLLVTCKAFTQEWTALQTTNWESVVSLAKSQNKMILLDCFATWCIPCKQMEKEVFSAQQVQRFFHEKFLLVKIQMDTTAHDDPLVRSWYSFAHSIQQQYKIDNVPAYLFFNADGKIVHKGLGYMNEQDFILLGNQALNPDEQYFTLLEAYQENSLQPEALQKLAIQALHFDDGETALAVAREYKQKYLDELPPDAICKIDNLQFITDFYQLIHSQDPFFKLFYNQPQRVNQIMTTISPLHANYAENRIKYVINKEEVEPQLWKGDQPLTRSPNWAKIKRKIIHDYNREYADAVIQEAQLKFYRRIEDWRKYSGLKDERIKKVPPKTKNEEDGNWMGDAWDLNVAAWDMFQHCSDKKVLRRALGWSNLSIVIDAPDPNVQFYDTKANLLYKLGKVKEAILCEQKAITEGIINAKKRGIDKGDFYDEYNEILKKMKSGEPTW